jgi:peptidoglycan/LPS O-acetylase OafA/YrhL
MTIDAEAAQSRAPVAAEPPASAPESLQPTAAAVPQVPDPAGSEPTPRLPALTGMRILAALAVYMSHLGPPHNAPTVLRTFVESGYVGVTMFFVLSGFVLALNYFENLRRPNIRRIWDYAVARFARIYPLYILILFYIILRRHAFGEGITNWWEHVLALQAWDPSVAQAYNFNAPAWSVSVEFFLYACFPFLVVGIARLHTPRALLLMSGAVALAMAGLAAWFVATGRGGLPWTDPESAHRWLYLTPLTRVGDFTLGILAARLYLQTRRRASAARVSGLLAILAGLVTVGLMVWPADLFSTWSWDVAYAIPAVLVIFGLAMAPRSFPARALSLPLVVLLGESSYAFYLIHKTAMDYLGAGRWSVATSATTIIYEALTLGAIICMAVGLHIVVERPARRYIRRLAERSDGGSPQAPWHGPREVLP